MEKEINSIIGSNEPEFKKLENIEKNKIIGVESIK